MKLSCKRGMQIAVYSAMFGRSQQGTLECPLHHRRAPSVGKSSGFCCLLCHMSLLQLLSKLVAGRANQITERCEPNSDFRYC